MPEKTEIELELDFQLISGLSFLFYVKFRFSTLIVRMIFMDLNI